MQLPKMPHQPPVTVLHGLVPPHLLGPTYPMWITPPAVSQLQQLAQQQQVRQAQQRTPPPKKEAETPKPEAKEQVVGGMKVMRTEPEQLKASTFQPVPPVFGVDVPTLPAGVRDRSVWM